MAYATIAELREYLPQVSEYGQQSVTISGTPTGGTFTLVYEGVATAALAYNATATAVQTALRAFAAIGATGVKVTGAPGGPYLASFQGVLATDAAPLSLGTNSLTGGSSPTVTIAKATDALLQKELDRATQIIDTELGFAFGTAAISTRVVYGDGTDYLLPPVFVAGTVTEVTTIAGYTVPAYVEQEGMLVVKTTAGVITPIYSYPTLTGFRAVGGWLSGVPYTVAATFGYAAVPKDIAEACLEIAVRLWRSRDAGFSDVVGVQGDGEVAYTGTYPKLVGRILERYRDGVPRDIGVW